MPRNTILSYEAPTSANEAQGKHHEVALSHLMRILIRRLVAVLRSGIPYQSNYKLTLKNAAHRLVERRNFCKAKDKEGATGKRSSRYQSYQGDKYATPDSTRGRVDDGPLRADHRRLFMLCWAARASDVLITPAPEGSRGRGRGKQRLRGPP